MDYGYAANSYSTTSYGAQGGANGGGFMNQGSQENPSGAAKRVSLSVKAFTMITRC
jgi:hypothetical protein